jgi:hypothetical protein
MRAVRPAAPEMRQHGFEQRTYVQQSGPGKIPVNIPQIRRKAVHVLRPALYAAENALDVLECRARQGVYQPFFLLSRPSDASVIKEAYSCASLR